MIRTWVGIISILSGLLIFLISLSHIILGFQNDINILPNSLVSGRSNSDDEVSIAVMQNIESWIDTTNNEYSGIDPFNGIEEIDDNKNPNVDVVTLTDSLNYELNIWIKVIQNKLNSVIPNLKHDIDIEIPKLTHLHNYTVWLPLLEKWEIEQNTEEVLLETYIDNILCNDEWDPQNEIMVYYNKNTGKQITQYVTRPLINSMMNKSLNNLTEFYNRLNSTLNAVFVKDYEAMVDQVVKLHISMFEEWGESVFTEWSERMANNDFLWDANSIPISTWRKYLNIKQKTIDKYNELRNFKPVSKEWHQFLNDCQIQLNTTFDKFNENLNKLMDVASKEFEIRDSIEKR